MQKTKRQNTHRIVNFRMDNELREQFDQTLDTMGLNLTSAFTLFAKAVVRSGKIPFDIMVDPFYKAENQGEIRRRIERYESGETTMVDMTGEFDDE
ncbi:MAG: type II toxin-antitoxin system RelB/DinJ family antitoxin [Defluviitaleaceae bacterium]|nr:type II toxin-antitoxin system RelB/DinJ family antitoxin [Defluviitaleaceae bacterium]MCL2240050.1 type II toxin-antitoxin system RelB/DinJ family antitoxin [Defluviitaleaceae bacterium]